MVRRTKEEAQETRSAILEAAERAFYERGVARTTLGDIATLAGVTRGAIYWHFSNKADVVQAMLDSLHEPLDALAQACESQDEIDPLGCMRKLLIHLFHQVAIDPKTRRINEILFHKCEFTDEICDLRRQRQVAIIGTNSPKPLTYAVQPSVFTPISTVFSGNGCWFPTVLNFIKKRSPGSTWAWICCA